MPEDEKKYLADYLPIYRAARNGKTSGDRRVVQCYERARRILLVPRVVTAREYDEFVSLKSDLGRELGNYPNL
jgi:hypothetical protein